MSRHEAISVVESYLKGLKKKASNAASLTSARSREVLGWQRKLPLL
jgi:hypothetical protein